jgi:hypothetical protein
MYAVSKRSVEVFDNETNAHDNENYSKDQKDGISTGYHEHELQYATQNLKYSQKHHHQSLKIVCAEDCHDHTMAYKESTHTR